MSGLRDWWISFAMGHQMAAVFLNGKRERWRTGEVGKGTVWGFHIGRLDPPETCGSEAGAARGSEDTTAPVPSVTPTRAAFTYDQDDIDAAAARIAYWWRMSFSQDYSESECEASYWDGPARLALRAVQEDRDRNPRGFGRAA